MSATPNLGLTKIALGDTSWKADEDTNKDTLDALFDATTGHTHDGTAGDGPNLPQASVANLTTDLAGKQPLDADLTTIAGLTATTDNVMQAKAGAWASRTLAQLIADLIAVGAWTEAVQDVIGAMVAAAGGTYNDAAGTIALPSGGALALDDLTDVNAPSPADGDVLTWESTPGAWVAAAPTGGNAAPRQQVIWPEAATNVAGAGLSGVSLKNGQAYGAETFNSSAANGDALEWDFSLAAGSYTLSILGISSNNRGKLDWTLDGTSIATAQDWYSGTDVLNVTKTISFTTGTSGLHTLRATVNGKNGGSSNYAYSFTKLWIR